jgi:hypothetical protein
MDHEWLELRWRTHSRSVMVAVHGTPYAIPPRNGKSNESHFAQRTIFNVRLHRIYSGRPLGPLLGHEETGRIAWPLDTRRWFWWWNWNWFTLLLSRLAQRLGARFNRCTSESLFVLDRTQSVMSEVFRGFLQSLQVKCGVTVPRHIQEPLPD